MTFIIALEFQSFMIENREWLAPYALFCVLRDQNATSNFNSWKKYKTITHVRRVFLFLHFFFCFKAINKRFNFVNTCVISPVICPYLNY